MIAEAQRRGGIRAFIDAEHVMDPAYAKRIGVNIDDLLVSQPDTGEQALEIAELLIRSGRSTWSRWTGSGATPKAEIEGEMGDLTSASRTTDEPGAGGARSCTLKSHRDDPPLHGRAAREDRCRTFGSPEKCTGAGCMKSHASTRLDIRGIEQTPKDGVEASGPACRVEGGQ